MTPTYATGPGRPRSAGPVDGAYADGALDRDCPHCGALRASFCRRADGSFKRVPCCTRLKGSEVGDGGNAAQRGNQRPGTSNRHNEGEA